MYFTVSLSRVSFCVQFLFFFIRYFSCFFLGLCIFLQNDIVRKMLARGFEKSEFL